MKPLTDSMKSALAGAVKQHARRVGEALARDLAVPETIPLRGVEGSTKKALAARKLATAVESTRWERSQDWVLTSLGFDVACQILNDPASPEGSYEACVEYARAGEAEEKADELAVVESQTNRVAAIEPYFDGLKGPGNYVNARADEFKDLVPYLYECFTDSPFGQFTPDDEAADRSTVSLSLGNLEEVLGRAYGSGVKDGGQPVEVESPDPDQRRVDAAANVEVALRRLYEVVDGDEAQVGEILYEVDKAARINAVH